MKTLGNFEGIPFRYPQVEAPVECGLTDLDEKCGSPLGQGDRDEIIVYGDGPFKLITPDFTSIEKYLYGIIATYTEHDVPGPFVEGHPAEGIGTGPLRIVELFHKIDVALPFWRMV